MNTNSKLKAAAKRGEIVRFTMSDFPNEFLCSVCNEMRPTSSFPTITSNDTEVRKSECRRCRSERIAAAAKTSKRSTKQASTKRAAAKRATQAPTKKAPAKRAAKK